ncbi:TonB-dependent receptor [Pseudoalteromonas luteoviolacea]|uniref:TonB-dependent receptor plug domain-containing protein n=1 Tax=Pseudoalteromonas luteoviolacea TaxID=43657 RepID=UPI001B39EE4E|nr:TonB-dependent receptor plug domain-containing protein [Pseudoalteromonas luteoviolacea]MBQ4877722.1 TonB-dependent receptor [Pseudoalteromonas luteoviolacea]MBQ4906832.1 TonB-dependent receptor [Pseudoalteromonas luteoviolacea]
MKTIFSFLCACAPFVVSAHGEQFEVIEVLAPKESLTIASANHTSAYLDERFTFSLNRTIADQLTSLSGVSLNGQGGQFQSYAIRGFSRGRIRTEIDGIPIITDRRAGNSASFIAPSLLNLGHVIKGPSSALYGSQAMGGVVSLSSEMSDKTQVAGSVQSNNQGVNLSFKHQKNDFTSAFAYQHANNDSAPNGDELSTQFERASALVRYKVQHQGFTATYSWLPSYGESIGKSNVKYPTQQLSDYPEELHSLAQVQLNGDENWMAKFYHHYQNWDSRTVRFERYGGLSQYQGHTLGGQWLQHIDLMGHESHWGIDWLSRKGVKITSDYLVVDEFALSPLGNEMNANEDNLALYGKTHWQWGRVDFDLGLRYDWLKQQSDQSEDATDGRLNASFAAMLPLSDIVDLGLDIGTGFRYPTLSERLFYGQTPRGLIVGNQALDPETSVGSQLSLHWHVSDEVSVYGAVYHYDLDNYIDRYETASGYLTYQNLSHAQISGFEAEFRWYASEYFEHIVSYQQQSGEDNHQQRLDDLHPRKLSWTMLVHFDNWSLSNAYRHTFGADEVGGSEIQRDAFTVWDVSVEHQLTDRQTVSVVINNLTDETYYGSLDEDAALQPERSVKLSTSIQF